MKTAQYKKYYNIVGDIFEHIKNVDKQTHIIIPHVCGNLGKFNSGFSIALAKIYPEAKINYEMLSSHKLGEIQIINIDKNKIIINMICENESVKKYERPLSYFSLIKCMAGVRQYIQTNYNYRDLEIKKCQIHAPRFGVGKAGGNWNFISELIDEIWAGTEVFIYSHKKEV